LLQKAIIFTQHRAADAVEVLADLIGERDFMAFFSAHDLTSCIARSQTRRN
jgi:hypothetical protein